MSSERTISLQALARPSGTFAMVAMDQRESLRAMLQSSQCESVPDHALVEFKLAVARVLSPYASGFLIDHSYGYRELVSSGLLSDNCGLLLAADDLVQPENQPVLDTRIDVEVVPAVARRDGVVALKLLVIWKDDEQRDRRLSMAQDFVNLCNGSGLISVLEGVVAPTAEEAAHGWDRDDAIVRAAEALNEVSPALYKAQVPAHGRGTVTDLARACEQISAVLDRPWVVLSNGVDPADFPTAVEAACRAGASGTLAGRAVWTAAVGAANTEAALREQCVGRLAHLGDLIDRYARPWRDAV